MKSNLIQVKFLKHDHLKMEEIILSKQIINTFIIREGNGDCDSDIDWLEKLVSNCFHKLNMVGISFEFSANQSYPC